MRIHSGGIGRLETKIPGWGSGGGLEGGRWPTQPHHDFLYPGFRIPISEFRIPYGVWGIRNTAPCTLGPRGRARGAGGRILAGCNGVGHGMSYLGVLCKQQGGTLDVRGGYLVA